MLVRSTVDGERVNRSDWLLLLLAFKAESDSPALDPIRVQKGMFLLAEEGGLPAEERYDFTPYNWGPYCRDVRTDLDRLVGEGYVQARDVPGYSWKRYGLTAAGIDYARHVLREEVEPQHARRVADIKQRVSSPSFNELLDDVYTAYPRMAVNSLFRRT
jgi:uncharacterized protein